MTDDVKIKVGIHGTNTSVKDLKKVKPNKAKLALRDQKKVLENLEFVGSNNKVNIIVLYTMMFATILYLSVQFFE